MSRKKYPQTETIQCPVWARLKLGRSVASDVFGVIYGYQSNGKQCYMSLNGFAFVIQCDVSSVVRAIAYLQGEEPETDKNRRILKDKDGEKVLKGNQTAVIEVEPRKKGESNLYKIKEEIIEQWKSEWQALINPPEPEKKKRTRKKSEGSKAEQPQSEAETEFEKILTADTNNKKRSFAPQSLNEVKEYWKEQCFTKSDPEDFYRNYQDNGWKRSWQDLAKKWEEREWDKEKPKEPTTKPSSVSRGSERDTDYNQLVRNMGLINNFSM